MQFMERVLQLASKWREQHMIDDIKLIRVWERYRKTYVETIDGMEVHDKWMYDLVGAIDLFNTAIFNSRFADRGDFELTLPQTDYYRKMFHVDTDEEKAKWGADGVCLGMYLTVDGIDDIFCVEKILLSRDSSGTTTMVISGSNGFGLLDGLPCVFVRAYSINVDGTNVPVQAIQGKQQIVTNGINGYSIIGVPQKYYARPIGALAALLHDGWRCPYLGQSTRKFDNAYKQVCGYKVTMDEDTADPDKSILDEKGERTNPGFDVSMLSDAAIQLCTSYSVGLRFNFEAGTASCPYIPNITVKDVGNTKSAPLTDKMAIIKDSRYEIDVSGMQELLAITGSKYTEKNFFTYSTNQGRWLTEDSGKIYTRRYGLKRSDLTVANESSSDGYITNLYVIANRDRRKSPVQSIGGSIELDIDPDDPLREYIVMGGRYDLILYGMKVNIYINGMTFVKDLEGLKIDATYTVPYSN